MIKCIVKEETPIHYDLLYKRLSCLRVCNKVENIKDKFDYIINMKLSDIINIKGDFYWYNNIDEIDVRKPKYLYEARNIKHICVEELSKAMLIIASKSFGILKKDLYLLTAREFGFNRTGKNITLSMENAYEYLLEQEKIKEIDGKITII